MNKKQVNYFNEIHRSEEARSILLQKFSYEDESPKCLFTLISRYFLTEWPQHRNEI